MQSGPCTLPSIWIKENKEARSDEVTAGDTVLEDK